MMPTVEGVGTVRNFPDYIARRPAMALRACKMVGEFLQHCADEGTEPPWPVPPFAVMMWIDMAQLMQELSCEGVTIGLVVPLEVRKWLNLKGDQE